MPFSPRKRRLMVSTETLRFLVDTLTDVGQLTTDIFPIRIAYARYKREAGMTEPSDELEGWDWFQVAFSSIDRLTAAQVMLGALLARESRL